MTRKLLIRTWAGPLPSWTPQFEAHVAGLAQYGWSFLVLNYADEAALEEFRRRAKEALGFAIKPKLGDRKICEFDPALAVIYPELVSSYDFWGHFNLDCVYGRLNEWLPDSLLDRVDVFANDPGAVCGPLTLYRNTPKVNNLFLRCEGWQQVFTSDDFHGFDEGQFSREVAKAARFYDIRFLSANWQSHDKMPCHEPPVLRIDGEGRLIECGETEIMMFHFNQTRTWPIQQ